MNITACDRCGRQIDTENEAHYAFFLRPFNQHARQAQLNGDLCGYCYTLAIEAISGRSEVSERIDHYGFDGPTEQEIRTALDAHPPAPPPPSPQPPAVEERGL